MSVLDTMPYPFHDAAARELHLVLAQLFPAANAALFAAESCGIPANRLNAAQPPFFLWKDILDLAAVRGRTRALVELAAAEFPHSPRHAFLADLLAGAAPALAAEPRSRDGAPCFRSGDDSVSRPEALLFHDDLSLSVGRLSALIATLGRIRSLLGAVCKLEVSCAKGRGHGTAFRIGADLLLSNWHVFYPQGSDPLAVAAIFGFEDDAAGLGLPGTTYACRLDTLVTDRDDDWGVIRTAGVLPPHIPVVPLHDVGVAALQSLAFIVQHPGGQRKRLAYVRNQVTYADKRVVHYLSDTQEGSSGSPVFDGEGRLIALHHAGGRPQEIAGQPPLKKNEGIAIARVRAGLLDRGVAF